MDAISASVDGEDPGIDAHLIETHLARCPSCLAHQEGVHQLRRTMVGPAAAMPDLSVRVSRLNAAADRARHPFVLRGVLVVVALEVIAVAVPALVLGQEASTSAHAARHLGAFSVAYAAALLLVVARPARAATVLPVTMVLAGALLVTAVVDIVEGRVPLIGEAAHFPELLSVVLVWLLARPPRESSPETLQPKLWRSAR